MQAQRQQLQDRLTLYQSLETRVLALHTAAGTVASSNTFQARTLTVSDSSAVSASADPGAPLGTYTITINRLAQAHKIRSARFTSSSESLGLEGDILINGTAIHLNTNLNLQGVAAAINAAGANVRATVLCVAADDYRLILTSTETGEANALDLVDANVASVLESLGLVESSTVIKHAITNGAASDQMTDYLTAVGEALGLESAPSATIQINGTDVNIDLSVDSLQAIANRINETVSGVTASVVSVATSSGTKYELRIVGEGSTPVFTDANNVLVTLGILEKPVAHVLQDAQDAEVIFDGQTVTRPTNSLEDLIEGLHIQLLSADPSKTITLNVTENLDTAFNAIRQLVQSYNNVVNFIQSNQTFDTETGEGGAFMGSYDVVRLENDLRAAVMYPVGGLLSQTVLVSQVGITTDKSNHLLLDETKLRSALATNPQAVRQLFALTAEATSQKVQYISSTAATRPSGASGYVVNITQPATQARAESASLPSGIQVNEKLTFNGEWHVNLYEGMSLDQAAAALNTMFTQRGLSLSASVDDHRLVIQHNLYGSGYRFTISSDLNRGVGGTDLGGETAGQPASYAGTDVAGTIAGEPATGQGRYLTGNTSNANTAGLKLLIMAESPGEYGVVRVAKGAGQRLLDVIAAFETPTTGTFARITDSINDQIEQVDNNIQRIEESLNTYLERLRQNFLTMETALARAQSLSQYISNQLIIINSLNRNARNQ
jgi:flagellar hook-associated protein 2